MRKSSLWLFAMCVYSGIQAQSGFESGYYITDLGERVNCLIRNKDWGFNPRQFKYKLGTDEKTLTASVDAVREFGIGTTHKYQRFFVAFDRTTDDIDKLSLVADPVNLADTVFLKVLVEGKANLYLYESGGVRRFFLKMDDQPIQQLVYKSYLTENRQVARNETYKEQLAVSLQCGEMVSSDAYKYEKRDMVRIFNRYNRCLGGSSNDFTVQQGKSSFHITIRPGVKFSGFRVSRPAAPPVDPNPTHIHFKDQAGLRFGMEAEFVLPMNNNKMSIIFEPTYQYYNSVSTTPSQPATTRYRSLELPVGVRYTVAPQAKVSFFFNLQYSHDLAFNSKIDFQNAGSSDLELKPGDTFCFGLGALINQKYNAELRIHGSRDLSKTNFAWTSNYSSFSFVLGYRLY